MSDLNTSNIGIPQPDKQTMINNIASIIHDARKEILWFSDDLEKNIFDSAEIFQAFKHFLIQPHPLSLTLIARHPEIAHSQQHTLIPLLQRLSSKIELRQANNKYEQPSFLIIDKKVLIKQIYNKALIRNKFEIIILNRAQQKEYLELFDKNYKDSQLSHIFRQLSL